MDINARARPNTPIGTGWQVEHRRGVLIINKKQQLPAEPADGGRKGAVTLSTSVYHEVRADIVAGRLKPGTKLRVEALAQRFSIASSPIREALNRLVSEGFVMLAEQRGFNVTPVSESELKELVTARCWIDGAAVTESIRNHDVAWEEGLVLALHRLSRVNRLTKAETPLPDPEWERLHREFHVALVAGCGSRWIKRISAQLFDAAERYRLLAAGQIPERNELDEHRLIADACMARKSQEAVRLLQGHYGKTFAVIMGSSNAPEK